MVLKNPHSYASRNVGDLQEANPRNPNFKAKSMNKKPVKGFGAKFTSLARKRKSKGY